MAHTDPTSQALVPFDIKYPILRHQMGRVHTQAGVAEMAQLLGGLWNTALCNPVCQLVCINDFPAPLP